MSIAGHMRQAEACREMLQDEAKRIADSTEARVWLNKNVGQTDPTKCLEVALRCIYDLTGDHAMLSDIKKLQEVKNEQADLTD